jgi:polyphenol oxidase
MSPFDSRVRTEAETAIRVSEPAGISVLTWDLFEGSGVDAVVTTRHGGMSAPPYGSLNLALHVGDFASAVIENRRRALGAFGAGIEDLVVANQVHGTKVSVVGSTEGGRGSRSVADAIADTDGLVTIEPGVVLGVLAADCAPVILFDPDAGVLGCAHAGWRGALGGVIDATVGSMVALGAKPSRMMAGIGPAIGASLYEVGQDVVTAADRQLGPAHGCTRAGRAGHWWFDLRAAVEMILLRAGLRDERIVVAAIDTGPPGPFFSARAEGRCGRFALLARITP